MTSRKSPSLSLVKLCVRTLEEKKAADLTVLDVSEQSSITNFLVLGTANSETHLRALRVELEKALDSEKTHIVGMETAEESGWAVVDMFDVMVHLFTPERRDLYALDRLWKDASEVSVSKLLAPEPKAKPAAKAKKPAKKPVKAGSKSKSAKR